MTGGAWTASADRALALATDQIQLIRAVTPRNAEAELTRLEHAYRRGERCLPEWQYDRPKLEPALIHALERLGEHLETLGEPLAAIYAARAHELAREAAIVEALGTAAVAEQATRRFLGASPADVTIASDAHELALAWSAAARTVSDPCVEHERVRARGRDHALVRSGDESHPDSLFCAMSRAAGRAHLPMRVVVQPGLASLAATGDGFILIADNRWIAARATARTVLHEIAGHAVPRVLAGREPLRIHVLATARGVDDQEGRALLIERASGFLDAERRSELAWRHLGAELALIGASFIDTVDLLTGEGAPLAQALRIAARVHRGGSGIGGLGREIVYLTALLRVERARSNDPTGIVEKVMSCGRIAAADAPVIAEVNKQGRKGERDPHRLGRIDTL